MTEKDTLSNLRHSFAHLLAAAVMELWPDTKRTIGPSIANGFYFDFQFVHPITDADLQKIEQRMRRILKTWQGFERHDLTADEAKKQYPQNPFKHELIDEFSQDGKKVSFFKSGTYWDLCRGGHVERITDMKNAAFKLTHIAGAYWRGDEKQPMLTRIYGLAFEKNEELVHFIKQQEMARERDHRKIGESLHLFTFSDLVGKGLPLLTEEGATIRRELERYIVDEEISWGYKHVITPPLAKVDLFKKSGHYPYYKESMYPIMRVDEEELILRPMTCPHHFSLFQSEPHSYRELPIRFAEISPQFRYEKSGELSGLMRLRMFTLADAHIFCRLKQAETEIHQVLSLIDSINKTLGLKKGIDYRYRLSLGDRKDSKKYFKDDSAWDHAEATLRKVLKKMKAPFVEAEGEAAFYGPKIDVQLTKVNGQEETAFTVQYDFVLPQRFALRYTNEAGKDEQPVVIHRSSIGCLERTIAFLIEHYAGNFPLWLSPVHVGILAVGKTHVAHCKRLAKEFLEAGLRIKLYTDNETVGYKIRQAAKRKIPYLLVIGDREASSNKLHIKTRGSEKLRILQKKRFIAEVQKAITKKAIKLP